MKMKGMTRLQCKHCARQWVAKVRELHLDKNNYCCGDYVRYLGPVEDAETKEGE